MTDDINRLKARIDTLEDALRTVRAWAEEDGNPVSVRDMRFLVELVTEALDDEPAVAIGDLFVESRWCHETSTHPAHNWSESGRDFFCNGQHL